MLVMWALYMIMLTYLSLRDLIMFFDKPTSELEAHDELDTMNIVELMFTLIV